MCVHADQNLWIECTQQRQSTERYCILSFVSNAIKCWEVTWCVLHKRFWADVEGSSKGSKDERKPFQGSWIHLLSSWDDDLNRSPAIRDGWWSGRSFAAATCQTLTLCGWLVAEGHGHFCGAREWVHASFETGRCSLLRNVAWRKEKKKVEMRSQILAAVGDRRNGINRPSCKTETGSHARDKKNYHLRDYFAGKREQFRHTQQIMFVCTLTSPTDQLPFCKKLSWQCEYERILESMRNARLPVH